MDRRTDGRTDRHPTVTKTLTACCTGSFNGSNSPPNRSMHHFECVAMCKDISLQRGRFFARSLASYIPRSVMNVLHPGCARPPSRLQFSGGGSKMAWLASAFSSIRARCPKKVRRRDSMMDESRGWLVMRRMPAFLTKSCQRMSRILSRHFVR